MQLKRGGREYASWTTTGAPAGTALEVNFNDAATWYPLTRTGDVVKVLVAGPDALANPAGTVVLAMGRNVAAIRVTDTPEIVIRGAGVIIVTP